jgi:hypothetical protein
VASFNSLEEMNVNIEQTSQKLALIGLKANVQQTGHPDYTRIFVIDKEGVSLGRITIFRGAYDHIKWYSGIIDAHSVDQWRPTVEWDMLLQTGNILTDETWERAKRDALVMQAKEIERLKQWRRDNPARINSLGKHARRRAIERPSQKKCIRELLKLHGLY